MLFQKNAEVLIDEMRHSVPGKGFRYKKKDVDARRKTKFKPLSEK